MRAAIALALLSYVAIVTSAPAESVYTNKFDNFDVDKVLNNERILTNYIKCLMDEGSCTNEGRELKKTIPDALAGGCSKCTEKQKAATEKVINHVMSKRKPDWERLSKKYDPNGFYETKYKALLEKAKHPAAPAAATVTKEGDAKKDLKESKEPVKVASPAPLAKPTNDKPAKSADPKAAVRAPGPALPAPGPALPKEDALLQAALGKKAAPAVPAVPAPIR
ncbi:hypothetical protein M8J76_009870 [Diaphorina citri]|uniref:Chemosensory protein 7 n=1 Tax=Diaphorina citri TaxID=121845 RepID=A0A7T3UZC3_DIACI|nr:hypothetical protein M8J75_012772 [Diaphorina citri]KAI5709085.1 hypothetical protein M8J76_009870 [Diaphorina citri]QPZ88906.1 chemosensory protein 7 [Diaphorina citri]